MNSNGYFTKSRKGSLPNLRLQVLKVDGSRGNLDQAVSCQKGTHVDKNRSNTHDFL